MGCESCHCTWWEMGADFPCVGSYDLNARAGARNGFVKMGFIRNCSDRTGGEWLQTETGMV